MRGVLRGFIVIGAALLEGCHQRHHAVPPASAYGAVRSCDINASTPSPAPPRGLRYEVIDGALLALGSDNSTYRLISNGDDHYSATRAVGVVGDELEFALRSGEGSTPKLVESGFDANSDGLADALIQLEVEVDGVSKPEHYLVFGATVLPFAASAPFARGVRDLAGIRSGSSGELNFDFLGGVAPQVVDRRGGLEAGPMLVTRRLTVPRCPRVCSDCVTLNQETKREPAKLSDVQKRKVTTLYREYLDHCSPEARLPASSLGAKEDLFSIYDALVDTSQSQRTLVLSFVGSCGLWGGHAVNYGERMLTVFRGDEAIGSYMLENGFGFYGSADLTGDGVDEVFLGTAWSGGGGNMSWIEVRDGAAPQRVLLTEELSHDSCPWTAPKYWDSKVTYRKQSSNGTGCLSVTREEHVCPPID